MSEDPAVYCTMAPAWSPDYECSVSKNRGETLQTTPKRDEYPAPKGKRDIFRIMGERDMAINLEHVTNMCRDGKRIIFQFAATSSYVDLEDEERAAAAYEQLLSIWSS